MGFFSVKTKSMRGLRVSDQQQAQPSIAKKPRPSRDVWIIAVCQNDVRALPHTSRPYNPSFRPQE